MGWGHVSVSCNGGLAGQLLFIESFVLNGVISVPDLERKKPHVQLVPVVAKS